MVIFTFAWDETASSSGGSLKYYICIITGGGPPPTKPDDLSKLVWDIVGRNSSATVGIEEGVGDTALMQLR